MRILDEQSLAEHGRRFFEITSNLLAIVDRSGGMIWVNESWEKLLGVPREELLGDGFLKLVHPDDMADTVDGIANALSKGIEIPNFENRYRAADGTYRVLLWSSTLDLESGLIYGSARDVTELRRSRDELDASRRRLAEAQRISHLGAWTYDPESGEVDWSEELYRIFRIDPSQYEPSYEGHMRLVYADDIDRLRSALQGLWDHDEPYEFDYRIVVGPDDEIVTLFTRARIERREDGSRYISGVCQDVTELRESEARLARSLAMHETILDATADGIVVTDGEGATVSWNTNFAQMWGIPERALEEHDRETITPIILAKVKDRDSFLERVKDLYANPTQEGWDILEFKDGRVWERYSAPHHVDGEVVGRVWSFRDITDRLRSEREKLELEARLAQSQRLESLGRLAGGIAHDFNNHLVAILNYASLARDELPEGAGRTDLDEVIQAAERASALTRELVAFSRQEMVEPRPLSLNELVADSAQVLRRTLGDRVELRIVLGDGVPAVEADPSQLERVLVNLAHNGRDAMPEGGVLEVSTERVDPAGADVEGSIVRLRVRDDGTGMSQDVATRALEPFFTTKAEGEGTGLGLATVYGVVNQNGGKLSIDSEPGGGTTVTIDLPASAKAPQPVEASAGETGPAARGTVLVVEDEEPVRRLTARLLSDAGFGALRAANGEEALELLARGEAEDLCLLLTDIVMPRMSGRELAERVQVERPDLPVLFMSGYTDDVVVRHGVATAELPFVAKPFTRQTLLDAVNEAIDGGSGRLA